MGTKTNPGPFDCYAAAEPDEPMFILLGRDRHAATLIWLWSVLRRVDGEDEARVENACGCVAEILAWQANRGKQSVGLAQAVMAGVFELINAANRKANMPDSAEEAASGVAFLRKLLTTTKFEGKG